ncbi:Nucleoporin NDC1 [Trichinella spiralis]|uniref:Nucleoporin NDC1 n=1 Tax=Trichinella spiralis TaxID=6334 RepID=A0ABR3KAD0_TRISP
MDDYLCLPHITKSSCGSTPLSFMMVPSTGNFRFRSSTASWCFSLCLSFHIFMLYLAALLGMYSLNKRRSLKQPIARPRTVHARDVTEENMVLPFSCLCS